MTLQLAKRTPGAEPAAAPRSERSARIIHAGTSYTPSSLVSTFPIPSDQSTLRGRRVIVICDQIKFCSTLLQLDGTASQIIICPPDFKSDHLGWLITATKATHLLTDKNEMGETQPLRLIQVGEDSQTLPLESAQQNSTEWVLFTSGTSGEPKLVAHSLETLAGAIPGRAHSNNVVWATFYDLRRFGGLQILLRALIGGSTLVVSSDEPFDRFIEAVAQARATHVTGTPSHWRRALMSPSSKLLSPSYVRLSGEIVDQGILDALRNRFPDARIGHAFASTEAGVAFEVEDAKAGFPVSFLADDASVALKIEDDSLRIKSTRCALRYVNVADRSLRDSEGYVDTGDMIEIKDGRCFFLGRRGGIINIGGLKVHPEEIESVINRHPAVSACIVRARHNPIIGSIVTADIVRKSAIESNSTTENLAADIAAHCRQNLSPHKVPATIRIVQSLELSTAGKLARHG